MGFIFHNRLGMVCEFHIEGQLAFDLKNNLINGLLGDGGNKNQADEDFDLEE